MFTMPKYFSSMFIWTRGRVKKCSSHTNVLYCKDVAVFLKPVYLHHVLQVHSLT